jgi:hypothetical protein
LFQPAREAQYNSQQAPFQSPFVTAAAAAFIRQVLHRICLIKNILSPFLFDSLVSFHFMHRFILAIENNDALQQYVFVSSSFVCGNRHLCHGSSAIP